METKETLREKLREIEEEEFRQAVENEYPAFKAMEGKCFKTQNCYSSPKKKSDYWPLYVKIQSIKKEDLYLSVNNEILAQFKGISFQTDNLGRTHVIPNYEGYVHSLEANSEISPEEFNYAWSKLLLNLSKML